MNRPRLTPAVALVALVAFLAAGVTIRDLAIDGRAVMEALGLPPGPGVGKALEFLLGRVIDDPGLNRPESLLAILHREYPRTP